MSSTHSDKPQSDNRYAWYRPLHVERIEERGPLSFAIIYDRDGSYVCEVFGNEREETEDRAKQVVEFLNGLRVPGRGESIYALGNDSRSIASGVRQYQASSDEHMPHARISLVRTEPTVQDEQPSDGAGSGPSVS
jgi:hypothetical protein